MNKTLLVLFTFIILLVNIFFIDFIQASCSENQINLNSATAEELDKIIYVGPATAEAIINTRPFNSVEDLIDVYGIGEIKLQAIKNQGLACVSGEPIINNTSPKKNETQNNEENKTSSTKQEDSENNIENKTIENPKEKESSTKEEDKEKLSYESNSNESDLDIPTLKTIYLEPKNIKSETDNEKINTNNQNKNNLAFYGLIVFVILLGILFNLRKKEKNEFD